MNGNGEGIKLPLKVVLGILTLAFTLGGAWFMVKDAPKEVKALTERYKEFEHRAHGVHHETEKRLTVVELQQVELRTNQTHILTGINDIKVILRRRASRQSAYRNVDGG